MIYTVDNTAALGKPVKVYLDGVEIKYCTYADTERGVVYDHVPPNWHVNIVKRGVVTIEPIHVDDSAS